MYTTETWYLVSTVQQLGLGSYAGIGALSHTEHTCTNFDLAWPQANPTCIK